MELQEDYPHSLIETLPLDVVHSHVVESERMARLVLQQLLDLHTATTTPSATHLLHPSIVVLTSVLATSSLNFATVASQLSLNSSHLGMPCHSGFSTTLFLAARASAILLRAL
jgi:hypothetical protein